MNTLEFLDRIGMRRVERLKIVPPRPRDTKMLVGVMFFLGYYLLVFGLMRFAIPVANAALVRDAMLVLGPVVGAIGQALFRTDVRDEMATGNTGAGFRAIQAQAEATTAAAAAMPPAGGPAGEAADAVADAGSAAARDKAAEYQGHQDSHSGASDPDQPMEP